jgi:hypothetical protein
MSPTHCFPAGPLAPLQLPTPGVPGYGGYQAPAHPVRGIAVFLKGLSAGVIPPTYGPPVDTGGVIPALAGTLMADLIADGWVVLWLYYPEDGYGSGIPAAGMIADIASDPGHGARYLQTITQQWDHVLQWRSIYYPGAPILPVGVSSGGFHAAIIAKHHPQVVVGSVSHVPATIWTNVNPTFAAPSSFAGVDTSGLDLAANVLVGVTTKSLMSYHTDDAAIGWAGNTTVAVGSNGVNVNTFAGAGVLNIGSNTGMVVGPTVKVTTGSGFASISFTGSTATTLTGCRTLAGGAGVLATGGSVVQSLTDAIITAGGANVTRLAGTGNHSMTSTDVTAIMAWIVANIDPIAPKVF